MPGEKRIAILHVFVDFARLVNRQSRVLFLDFTAVLCEIVEYIINRIRQSFPLPLPWSCHRTLALRQHSWRFLLCRLLPLCRPDLQAQR